MAFSLPCDACGTPLRGRVFAVRVSTFAVTLGAPVAHRLVPAERPSDYLFCTHCTDTLTAYVQHVQANRGVPRAEAG
ncbi:MAG: hypothetical protein WCI61_00055 [Chloroflexota bacterium]